MTDTLNSSTIAERLADFTRNLAYNDVPNPTHELTKLHILDVIGCALFATRLPLANALNGMTEISPLSGAGGYSVIGMGRTSSPGDASLINGVLGAAFELDTGGVYVHPAPPILGAALAAAEHRQQSSGYPVSGRDLMMAFLVGHEVTVRVSEWVGFAPEHYVGWHTPAFHGAIGAAASAARLLDLDVGRTASALAIAADLAGGGLIHARNDSKRIHTGRAAQSGYLAAVLAAEGVAGGLDILEHKRWGYYRALRYGGDSINPADDPSTEKVTADLFTRFESYSKLAFKYYPFHSAGQTILDSVSSLRRAQNIHPGDVVAIRIGVSTFMHDHDAMLRPATTLATANFSFPYAAALALVVDVKRLTEVGASADAFLDGFADSRVQELQNKVVCEVAPELDAENLYNFDTIIRIDLKSGASVTARTEYGKRARATGSLGSIAFDSVEAKHLRLKFASLTSAVFGQEKTDALVATLGELESEPDLEPFLGRLAQRSEPDVRKIATGGRHGIN